jgi:formylglycine-generating enzyme required for sulfatase activity
LAGDESIDRVNAQLLASQQEELKRLVDQGLTPPGEMVLIPAGEFLMGMEDGLPDARPIHRLYMSAYWIDRHGSDERAVPGLCGWRRLSDSESARCLR